MDRQELLKARQGAWLTQALAASGAGPIHERGAHVRGGRRLPDRFDWVQHPDEQGHVGFTAHAGAVARIAALAHASDVVRSLAGLMIPVEVPRRSMGADWLTAAIARRDERDGHAWAVAAGVFAGAFTDSTHQVSHWVTLDDDESVERYHLALDRLTTLVESVPADQVTGAHLAALARRAWQGAYRTFDQGKRSPNVPPVKPRKVRTVEHRRSWSDVADHLVPVSHRGAWSSSLDPMRPPREVLALETAADMFLREHGVKAQRPDVLNRWTWRWMSRADHAVHAATKRYTLPQPCEYVSDPAITSDGVQHYATGMAPTEAQRLSGERVGWIGHERARWCVGVTVRDKRKVARSERQAQGATERGPVPQSPWSITERRVRARCTGALVDQVARLENALRSAAPGALVQVGDAEQVTTDGVQVIRSDGHAYPVREYARRATLAGLAS